MMSVTKHDTQAALRHINPAEKIKKAAAGSIEVRSSPSYRRACTAR